MKCFLFFVILAGAARAWAQPFPVKTIFAATGTGASACSINEGVKTEDDREPEIYTKVEMDDMWNVGENNTASLLSPYLGNIRRHFKQFMPETLRMPPAETWGYPGSSVRLARGKKEYILTAEDGRQLLRGLFRIPLDQSFYNGFTAYQGGNCLYVNRNGRQLLSGNYDFAESWGDGFIRVSDSGKKGLCDSSGALVLPFLYKDAYGFYFNGSTWFWLYDGVKSWYQQKGAEEKIMIPEGDKRPDILFNQYWLTGGKVYDMAARKRLFCAIGKSIDVYDLKAGVLKIITDQENFSLLFDVKGNMLFEYPCRLNKEENSRFTVVALATGRDTLLRNRRVPLPKYGLTDSTYKWVLRPEYDYLEAAGYDCFVFAKNLISGMVGLTDANGKVLVAPGRFLRFSKGIRPLTFICLSRDSSLLFNAGTGIFETLPEKYYKVKPSGWKGVFEATVFKKGGKFAQYQFVDSNYTAANTAPMASLHFQANSNEYECRPPDTTEKYGAGRQLFYIDSLLRTVQMMINGRAVTSFRTRNVFYGGLEYIELFDNTRYLKCSDKIIQLPDTVEVTGYNTAARWLEFRNRRGKRGLLNENGKEILPAICNGISFNGAFAELALNGGRQIVNRRGELLFGGRYQLVAPLLTGCYKVVQNGKMGVVNENNEILIPLQYDYIKFDKGLIEYGINRGAKNTIPARTLR